MHWGFLYQREDDSVEKTADICGLDLKGYIHFMLVFLHGYGIM